VSRYERSGGCGGVVHEMTNSVLFIAADPREFIGFLSHWHQVQPLPLPVHWARTGRWKGREVHAIANGAGAERAFAAVLVAPKSSAICNIGFCGALDENLQIGDVFVATEVRNGSRTWPALLPDTPKTHTGAVASIDHIAQTASEKSNLRASGASIVEMEAGGVARASEDLGLPFYCIRAVSDLAREDFATDFNAALGADGRFSTMRLLSQLNFGELIRLKQRTDLASKKLGDFLAASTF
jgi:adenosylhomocysteine nucleosidase